MRYLLAMCALCCGTVAGGQPLPSEPSVTVLLLGDRVPLPVLKAMEREAESTILRSTFMLDWKFRDDLQESVVNGRMAIVYMRGQCSPDRRTGTIPIASPAGTPLGLTHIADGQVLPIADVLCDAVRGLVDRGLGGGSAKQREDKLGRALGRVLAHELYHILLQSTEHGHQGLSRSGQSSFELLSPHGGFVSADEHRIAESLSLDANGLASDGGR